MRMKWSKLAVLLAYMQTGVNWAPRITISAKIVSDRPDRPTWGTTTITTTTRGQERQQVPNLAKKGKYLRKRKDLDQRTPNANPSSTQIPAQQFISNISLHKTWRNRLAKLHSNNRCSWRSQMLRQAKTRHPCIREPSKYPRLAWISKFRSLTCTRWLRWRSAPELPSSLLSAICWRKAFLRVDWIRRVVPTAEGSILVLTWVSLLLTRLVICNTRLQIWLKLLRTKIAPPTNKEQLLCRSKSA